MNTAFTMILNVLGSMATKLLSEKFFKWAILWGAKRYVQSTKTPHDDAWFKKIEELIGE